MILVTDFHSYPYEPYDLLEFGIGVLLLEAVLAITTLVKELLDLLLCCIAVVSSVTVCVYESCSMKSCCMW